MCDEKWNGRITFKPNVQHINIQIPNDRCKRQTVGPGEMFCNKNLVIRNLFVSGSGFKKYIYIFSILKCFQFSYNLQTWAIGIQACNMVWIWAFWIQILHKIRRWDTEWNEQFENLRIDISNQLVFQFNNWCGDFMCPFAHLPIFPLYNVFCSVSMHIHKMCSHTRNRNETETKRMMQNI